MDLYTDYLIFRDVLERLTTLGGGGGVPQTPPPPSPSTIEAKLSSMPFFGARGFTLKKNSGQDWLGIGRTIGGGGVRPPPPPSSNISMLFLF